MPETGLPNIQEGLKRTRAVMSQWSDSALLDAQVLIAHIINKPRAWVLAYPEASLSAGQIEDIERALSRLKRGESLPYVLGHREFYGLDFIVTPHTLIPRPETELLVEHALAWLETHPSRRRVVDVGTGSGCISIILAKHIPNLSMFGTDLSWHALRVARKNAYRYKLKGQVRFIQCDLLSGIQASFDLICANLPYIPTQRLQKLQVFKKEPTLALDGGLDGFHLLRRLLQQAPARLAPGGLLLLEIDASHPEKAQALARGLFPNAEINVFPDLAGENRLLSIQDQSEAIDLSCSRFKK